MRIQTKLLASLLGTALVPLLVVAGITYANGRQSLIGMAGDRLAANAQTLANRAATLLADGSDDLAAWSRLDALQGVFIGEDIDLAMGLLLRDLTRTTDFVELWCVDTSGNVVAASDFKRVGAALLDSEGCRIALAGRAYAGPVRERLRGGEDSPYFVLMAQPIRAAFDESKVVGALMGRFDWRAVMSMVRDHAAPGEGSAKKTLLLDGQGVVVAGNWPGDLLEDRLGMAELGCDPDTVEVGRRVVSKERNADILYGVARAGNAELGLEFVGVAGVEERVILRSVRHLERNIFLVSLAAVGAVILVALLLTKKISLPILALSTKAREAAEGRLDVPIRSAASGEIGALAADLDAMRANLKRHIDSLDAMVQERTAELEATVARLREEIHDREEAEKQASLQQRQLVQADKMVSIGIMASGVAHEVNNPNGLIGLNLPVVLEAWNRALPVLREYYEEEGEFSLGAMDYSAMKDEIPRIIEEMHLASERIKRIVNDLKDFSRQGEERPFLPVDLNQVAHSAVNLAANHIRKSTNAFSERLSDDLPLVLGHFQRIEQVVINLIINACQALTDESQPIELETRFAADDNAVILEVRDGGSGIAPGSLPHLTDPFFTTKRESGGTGLGLSVSAGIVDEHGGRLEFDSRPGQGTCARIVLPIRAASETESS